MRHVESWGTLLKSVVDNNLPTLGETMNTDCQAVARSRISMQRETLASVAAYSIKKGDVLGVARFAAVQAAKSSSSLLPLSSPTLIRTTSVEFILGDDYIDIEVTVQGTGLSVVMSAFSAAATGTLSIYDMCKSADRTMVIGPVELVERSGHSGTQWRPVN